LNLLEPLSSTGLRRFSRFMHLSKQIPTHLLPGMSEGDRVGICHTGVARTLPGGQIFWLIPLLEVYGA
jgi:hypothetical protein